MRIVFKVGFLLVLRKIEAVIVLVMEEVSFRNREIRPLRMPFVRRESSREREKENEKVCRRKVRVDWNEKLQFLDSRI